MDVEHLTSSMNTEPFERLLALGSELIFKEIHTCVWVWDVWMNIFSLEIYNELYGQGSVHCAYSFRDRERALKRKRFNVSTHA